MCSGGEMHSRLLRRLGLGVIVLIAAAYWALLSYVYVYDAGWPIAPFNAEYRDSRVVRTDKLAENIYMLSGAGGNVTVLIGDKSVLLVDTGPDWFGERIEAAIGELTDKPVEIIVVTHGHGDHFQANARFIAKGARVIAHRNARNVLLWDRYAPPTETYAPLISVIDDAMAFEFGGETVRLTHVPRAHTSSDITVTFETSRILATGDLFVHQGLPFIDESRGGNIDGYLGAMDALIAQTGDMRAIVPGHGKRATRDNLIDQRLRLGRIRESVAFGREMGLSQRFVLLIYPTWAWPLEWNDEGMSQEYFARVIYRTLDM